jgi:broad specificity phosphatase PhoE
MRQIYLVRHGVIDYKSLGLASEGLAYARRLPDLLPDPIDFLASDEEARCVATMEPLASKRSLILRRRGSRPRRRWSMRPARACR